MGLAKEILRIWREGTAFGSIAYLRHKLRMRRGAPAPTDWVGRTQNGMGILGAGVYTASVHLPLLRLLGVPLAAIASATGGSAASLARIYKIGGVGKSAEDVIAGANVTSLFIATPHFRHPDHIVLAANSGLYTYCEKPVAVDTDGVTRLEQDAACRRNNGKIMVGFNRRFAPAMVALRSEPWLAERSTPMEIHYRVNFGARTENAMSDPKVGGGRIHGAACHYVDLIAYLAGAAITWVAATACRNGNEWDENTFAASFALADGSVGSLVFTSEGNRDTDAKEEIKVTCGQHTASIRDFNRLRTDGRTRRFFRHSYGALAAWRAFLAARDQGQSVPVPLSDGLAATRVTLAMQQSIRHGKAIELPI